MNRVSLVFRAICPVLICCLLTACGAPSSQLRAPTTLPRADAGHTNWLEQHALLARADRNLLGSATWPKSDGSVEMAAGSGVWLLVRPQTLTTGRGASFLAEISRPETLSLFTQLGLSGIYLDNLRPSGGLWKDDRETLEVDSDITTTNLADDTGTPEALQQFIKRATASNLLLGGELVPPFTGTGPDFLLATQNLRAWPRVYGMWSVPRDKWNLLPDLPTANGNTPPSVAALPASGVTSLHGLGVLPTLSSINNTQFWAVTGEVSGYDGVTRRWVYRALRSPSRPILCWPDVAGQAQRIMMGLVPDTVGNGQVRMAGIGLEAGQAQYADTSNPSAVSDMLRQLRRTVHANGAVLAQRDRLPADTLTSQMEAGADFVLDSVSAPLAEYALLTGDAAPLRAAFDEAVLKNVDQRRLIRPLTLTSGVRFSEAGLPDALGHYTNSWSAAVDLRGGTVSVPGMAAMRAGLVPGPELLAAAGENRKKVQPLHEMLLMFRGGLPGILEITGQDLAGIVCSPLNLKEYPKLTADTVQTLPAWGLDDHVLASNRRGVPTGTALYQSIPKQLRDPESFVWSVIRMSKIRADHGIAKGTLIGRPLVSRGSSMAALTQLPDNSHLLTVVNFSDTEVVENLLPLAGRTAQNLWTGDAEPIVGNTSLTLPPFSCKLLRLR